MNEFLPEVDLHDMPIPNGAFKDMTMRFTNEKDGELSEDYSDNYGNIDDWKEEDKKDATIYTPFVR